MWPAGNLRMWGLGLAGLAVGTLAGFLGAQVGVGAGKATPFGLPPKVPPKAPPPLLPQCHCCRRIPNGHLILSSTCSVCHALHCADCIIGPRGECSKCMDFCSLGHGASHDFASKARRLSEVKRRGRWPSSASVRRYEKGARVAELLHRLPLKIPNHALQCEQLLERVVAGSLLPFPGP